MIRLTLLTLAALFGLMLIYGEPGARVSEPVAEPQEQVAETEPERPVVAEEPAPPVVEVSAQTPEQVPDFPGPDLQPSPEHAGDEPAQPAATAADLPDGATILYVTGDKVNFRAGPTTGDTVVGSLLRGSPVEAIGPTDGGWVQIRDVEGRVGFMSAQFLSANRTD